MTTTIESIDVDKKFVSELISAHDPLQAIRIIKKLVGGDMNPAIKDNVLRIMLWQIMHSLEVLEEKTNISFYDVSAIIAIGASTDSKSTRTISRHLTSAFENMIEYVTFSNK